MTGAARARPAGPFTALVLAGSRGGQDPVARHHGVTHKCLVPAGGVPMLLRVLEALAATPAVDRIFVSLQDPEPVSALPELRTWLAQGRCAVLASGATPCLSVLGALQQLPDSLPMLVTTADHPLLTPAMVEGFCRAARATDADLAAGLTPAAVIRKAYPETRRTYLRFRDGRYSGANLFALLTPEARTAIAFWRRVEQERKRPWRMIRAFGAVPLLAYLLGLWTLDTAMTRASTIIGARVAAIRLPFAEAAIDVDKPADLELVDAILARRS